MAAVGFDDVEIVVTETRWPSIGDEGEVGASMENANEYNDNLTELFHEYSKMHLEQYFISFDLLTITLPLTCRLSLIVIIFNIQKNCYYHIGTFVH